MKARDAWTAKRDLEAQRIRADMDKYFDAMEKCADRLEIRAGMHFHPGEYGLYPPISYIESVTSHVFRARLSSRHRR